MEPRPPLAPGVLFPALCAHACWMLGPRLLAWSGVPEDPVPWNHLLAFFACAVCAVLAVRIHRRWRRAQGLDMDRIPRRWRPEWGIALGVYALGLPLGVWWVGRGTAAGAILLGAAILSCVTLVVVAAVKEPRRRREDAARHRARRAEVQA